MSQLPAAVTIPELPTGTTPTGTELLEAVQGGDSVNLSVTQIASAPMSPKSANLVLAGPASGVAAVPTFRAVVAADIPAPVQRLVTGAGQLPIVATDEIINLNCAAPLAITLPTYASRNGRKLRFKDVGGLAGSHTITLNRASASASEDIDGQTSVTITVNYAGITLVPANDGTTTGWSFE